MGEFQYEPLSDPHHSIRLIELKPRRSHPEFLIRTFHFSKCPKYVALSYMWGPSDLSRKIILDWWRTIRVRKNLFDALQSIIEILREHSVNEFFGLPKTRDNSGYIWIDAICINQENLDERTAQVGLMPSIYSNAIKIISWLGRSDDESNDIIEILRNYSPNTNFGENSQSQYESVALLLEIYEKPYWKRAWIIQELLKARDIEFVCGNQWFSWSHVSLLLADSVHWLEEQGLLTILLWKWRWYNSAGTPKQSLSNSVPSTRLAELIETFKDQQCQDPRDHVYAYLGLAGDEFSLPLSDYTKIAERVFVDFLEYLRHGQRKLTHTWKVVLLIEGLLEVDSEHELVISAKLQLLATYCDPRLISHRDGICRVVETLGQALISTNSHETQDLGRFLLSHAELETQGVNSEIQIKDVGEEILWRHERSKKWRSVEQHLVPQSSESNKFSA